MAANRRVNVTEFKAQCLAMITEVETGRKPLTVTRRGKPVVTLIPAAETKPYKSSAGSWSKRMSIVGDIVNKDYSVHWEMARNKK